MPVYTSPLIRDELIVDQRVEDICRTYAGNGPVFLLARRVVLAKDLRIAARPVVIVADEFDGNGFQIDAHGDHATVAGHDGAHAVPWSMPEMYTADGRPKEAGRHGGGGGAGVSGTDGQSVTIYARRTVGVRVSVAGGNGTNGGRGGNGSAGGNGYYSAEHTETRDLTPSDPYDFEFEDVVVPAVQVDGTPGGSGGWGGNGGNGGNGGSVTMVSITDAGEPVFATGGGTPGGGGAGGAAGIDGAYSPGGAAPGEPGQNGAWGAEGIVARSSVTDAEFVAGLRPLLDSTGPSWADYWAPFRIAMGEYHYHRFNPSAADPGDAGQLAAVEIARGLELQPDNGVALRLRDQLVGAQLAVADGAVELVGGGVNVLGQSPNLDILPDFNTYMNAFQGFAPLATGFLLHGIDTVFQSGTTDALRQIVEQQKQAVVAARERFDSDVEIGRSEQEIAVKDAEFIKTQLDQATADLEAAMAEMQESSFSFGDIVGTVAQVAGAVVGVIAAIPTAGASLVAVVPAVISLASTVTAQAAPVVQALLDGSKADTKQITDAYKKVGKEVDVLVDAGKKVVNFVTLVQKLTASATVDTSKQVALVRRGVELAHQLLIAQNRVALAQQRIHASEAQATRAAEQIASADALAGRLTVSAESVREVGLLAIGVAQSSAEALNSLAYRAARSVEILTLQPQAANLSLDAGVLSPDTWRRYAEQEFGDVDLARMLTASWGRMLQPLSVQQDYLAYFEREHDQDVLTRIFRPGDREFDSLLARGRFDFTIDPLQIPAGRADAKIRSVRLALVGATHPSGGVSCEVRHGGKYQQRRADGTVDTQLLQPRTGTRRAELVPLSAGGDPVVDVPLTAPLSLKYWGRGIGGDWDVSVVGMRDNAGLDVSGLVQVQVEVRYQFVR